MAAGGGVWSTVGMTSEPVGNASHKVSVVGGRVSVSVTGEIDMSNADQMREWICRAIKEHPGSSIEIDFDRLSFLDSQGIRALIHARREAVAFGARLHVVNTHGMVDHVLRVTGVLGSLTNDQPGEA